MIDSSKSTIKESDSLSGRSLSDIQLTHSQQIVLDQLSDFITDLHSRVFILKGYAGTGKTTLMRFLIQILKKKQKGFTLLAPTGRAAKVLSDTTGEEAKTIHSMIYTFSSLNKDLSDTDEKELKADSTGQLFLNFEPVCLDTESVAPTIYVIDEASMVSDLEETLITQAKFGSGRLLSELLKYDTRSQSKFIFVGDPCQLPPVKDTSSPALMPEYFQQQFHLMAKEASLTQIMRQKGDNDLIRASLQIRKICALAPENEQSYHFKTWKSFPLRNCRNTQLHSDWDEMIRSYYETIKRKGFTDAIFISASNKKCYEISMKVRSMLGLTNGVIQKGDLLMVVQNNQPTGLINGDMVEVVHIDEHILCRADLEFRSVKVREILTGEERTSLLLVSTISNNTPNLDSLQQTRLFIDFAIRMRADGITQKKDPIKFYMAMQSDPYLNALRCSYGYAVTCHKAQGGEWNNVYVDFGMMACNPTKEKCQWVYTAITRAKETLHVLNKPYIQ
ncbi:MAG: AAA family ATPase [Paludibacteraceae bacterium]|nr:AAA family ATPase [Paludibacteraceae bacterium]